MEDEEVIREKIRTILIALRIAHGWTQEQVGDMVGKSKTAIASWEQGKSLPAPEMLWKLAMIYGTTMDQMYGVKEGKFDVEHIQKTNKDTAETGKEST